MPVKASTTKAESAGLLLFKNCDGDIQFLLGHPGGPFWSRKDADAWSIPKGLISPGEEPLAEFAEETGHHPRGDFIPLGAVKQAGGKVVHA